MKRLTRRLAQVNERIIRGELSIDDRYDAMLQVLRKTMTGVVAPVSLGSRVEEE